MGDLLSLKALLSVGVVIALLVLALWALRRGVLHLPAMGKRSPILVETATSLGDRRSLAIVNVEGRRVLIGVTPSAISLVADLSAAPVVPRDGREVGP